MSILPGLGFLGATYPWVLAAHVIFVIFLMASLFMMPRFFVYHHQTEVGSPEDKAWIEREQRLKRIILNPSIILVWVFGLMLAFNVGAFSQGWFHAKLAIVLALTAYHFWLAFYASALARGERRLAGRKLRLLNEVPGIAAALIVVLAVVKPF